MTADEVEIPVRLAERLDRGQAVNIYETDTGLWAVCIGPVTDALIFATTAHKSAADWIASLAIRAHLRAKEGRG